MAQCTVLHVGAMKSGTSSLQSRLFANKALLAEQGVLVPGATWSDQVAGVLDVLGRRRDGQEDVSGSWQRLLDETQDWPGTAVISMEFLGPVAPKKIARVVASLRTERVRVVLTARDLNRSLAAMWQETIQNGRWWSWDDYLEGARRDRPVAGEARQASTEAGRTFWRQQNTVRLSRQWSQAEGVDDFVLVTLPPPGAPGSLLNERFAEVVGYDDEALLPSPHANASVDAAAAEVLRRVNESLAGRELLFPAGSALRKQRLAKTVLAARSRQDLKIGLPVAEWVHEHAETMVGSLQRQEVDLVGAWQDLAPVPVPGIHPGQVSEDDVREAAQEGLAGMAPVLSERLGEQWSRLVERGQDGEEPVALLAEALAAAIERARP